MIIKLGYACISKTIDVTTSKTISYTNYLKLSEEEQYKKLDELIKSNLMSLNNLIDYNIKNNIHFFRLFRHMNRIRNFRHISELIEILSIFS